MTYTGAQVNWAPYRRLQPDLVTCACGASFWSYTQFIAYAQPGGNPRSRGGRMVCKLPCPACGRDNMVKEVISAPWHRPAELEGL
jgi:hypothetical protein